MRLADLIRPGVLRGMAAAPAGTVATVATVTVATTDRAIVDACRLAGVEPAMMPAKLRADLLNTEDASLAYLAEIIRDSAGWEGWAGGVRLADYAPGGVYYREQ